MDRMRRQPFPARDLSLGAPISELNTTPLIDVMLVLLIMFIITIPTMTHSVKIDLPSGRLPPAGEPEIHMLTMNPAGGLTFDGAPIPEGELRSRLHAMENANPLAVLHFRIEGEARYEDFDRVLAEVKKSGVQNLGFVGNHAFAGAI
jgi:biopolymer transport protein ExbD